MLFENIRVKIGEENWMLTTPQFNLTPEEAVNLGLKTTLWTSEEAAEMPELLQHLKKIGFGGLKKILKPKTKNRNHAIL